MDKKTLNNMFFRCLMYGASWNFERMQNLGFLYTIKPALKKVYKNDKDEMATAMKRHLEFFNTHQTAAPFIIGVTSAMEEEEGNKGGESITGLKVGLMGPLAGIGDSLIWLTLVPICFSIGASYSMDGSVLGLFLALFLINIINVPLKYYGLKYGYNRGSKFIKESSARGTLDKVTNMAVALGLILVGGLIPQMVGVNFALEFQQGELIVSIQDLINQLIPGFIPMGLTLIMYKFIKKGKNPVHLILITMAAAIVLVLIGVLK
nr:PTS system mannose/fructose/sorbose family transporter subunit IID [Granulicatella balaenopterae]